VSAAASGTVSSSRSRIRVGALLRNLAPLAGLVCVWGLFALLVGERFSDWDNQRLMLLQTAVVGTAAVGATAIIIAGGIDLSVGSTIALGTVVIALLLQAGLSPLLAALGGVGVGLICGLAIGSMVIGHAGRVAAVVVGGLVVSGLWGAAPPPAAIVAGLAAAAVVIAVNESLLGSLPLAPFIVTLGMWGALRGAAKGLGDNQPVYPDSIGWMADLMSVSATGLGRVLPPAAWVLLLTALLVAGVLRYTRFGRHVFAIGSSERAARLCGVRVDLTKLLVYVLGVGCAGIAAVLQLGYISIGDPTTAQGYELRVIAAVVIGGASLSGGEGSVRGTLIGALIMTVVDNGCTKLELANWVQEVVTGAIIVAAVGLDRLRQRRAESARATLATFTA
jgi:ribose/xylose/arabinose/galactoside ABC-type transport system permease subunit